MNPSYTVRGELAGVGWPGGSTSYVYLLDGKVDYQARTNGVTTTYGYDGRGMIGWVRHTKGNNDLAKREYWRDDRDRITAWKRGTDPALNQMEDGRGDRYGYDPEGQLTAASYRAATPEQTPSGALRTDSFVYDELGNRMGANRVANRGAVLTFSRRDNGLNQYLNWTPSAIYYDDNLGPPNWVPPGNGVMMAEGYITASFNALNQPMAIWSQAYGSNFLWFGFDPLGRCVKRWTTTADRSYVHGGRVDEIVASQVSGVWYNHHYDGQGNCILLSTINGGLQEQYDYDAFGFPYFYDTSGNSLPISSVHTRFLFTGREWLSDLRIYDYRARQYQPELGRFLQPDPKEFGAGDYNLYRYCHNDPVNKNDPYGLYGRGTGFTDEQWKKVDIAQKEAADRLEMASKVMDAKVFEKVFGPGSATAENMAKVQATMKAMAAALRDDGTKGYIANGMRSEGRTLAQVPVGGKTMEVNVAHRFFGSPATLLRTVGHESGHSAGLGHGIGANGATAYWGSRNKEERAAFDSLPTAGRLGNPDHYLSFAQFYNQ